MSRISKFLLVFALGIFGLACGLVSRPVRDAQNIAGTAQSLASAMPIETLAAMASQIPMETLESLPSAIPNVEKLFNPQGTPVSEWNGIPIMSQATAGQEFNEKTYSFKANVKVQEVYDFYNEKLASLGWSQSISMPVTDAGGLLAFSKDDAVLTITIASTENSTAVLLNLG